MKTKAKTKRKSKAVKVIFRKERHPETAAYSILAIFPDLYERGFYGGVNITCYSHIGQHSEMSRGYFADTKPVKDRKEYLPLLRELQKIYGALRIVKRCYSWRYYCDHLKDESI